MKTFRYYKFILLFPVLFYWNVFTLLSTTNTTEKYTLLINTFNRETILNRHLQHYVQCNNINEIIVTYYEKNLSKVNNSKIKYHFFENATLNNRYNVSGIMNEAVLILDDDLYAPCNDLDNAFNVWSKNKYSIVGFFPRLSINNTYYGWFNVLLHQTYNIILTKAAMLNRKYVYEYTNELNPAVKSVVEQYKNCEDIAMQYLISSHNNSAIFIRGNIFDFGSLGGVSTSLNSHYLERNKCLELFSNLFNLTLKNYKLTSFLPSTLFEFGSI